MRCSNWARAAEVDPVGSVGSYTGFLLIEVPLPWPRDISEVPEVAEASDLIRARGSLRVQGLVPADESPRQVIAYVAPAAGVGYGTFVRRSALIGAGGVREAVAEVLGDGPGDGAEGRDVLVCTHGRRDRCCGSLGTSLTLGLASGSLPADVRLWRTSHTGGHRFAPTFIVLPEATGWAFADVDLVERVLSRSGDFADVADRYRGCAALGSPRTQAVEREVLCRVGWELLDRPRAGSEQPDGTVHLLVHGDGDEVDCWSASVVPGRIMPVPDCMHPLEDAKKSETEWVVRDLRRV